MPLPNLLDQRRKPNIRNEKGQSLVEFVLLLSVIMLLSLGFLKVVNGNVSKYWLAMAKVLVEDDSQELRLR